MTDPIIHLPAGQYFGAVRRRFVSPGATLVETTYTGEATLPQHCHGHPTFFLIVRGCFVERCGQAERTYYGSTVSYHPAHTPHSGRFVAPTSLGFGIGFNVELGPDWAAAVGDEPGDDAGESAWLLARLYRELNAQDDARCLAVQGLTWELAATMRRRRSRMRAAERTGDSAVIRAADLLSETEPRGLRWAGIADAVGRPPDLLARAFRARYGCTPAAYVRRQRFARATRQLAETRMSLAEVAASAGFYDQPHFTRVFKAATGLTPAAYRRAMSGRP